MSEPQTTADAEAELDRMLGLAAAIARTLDAEPSATLRFAALATALKVQAFVASASKRAALQQIELVGDVAGEQLLDDWDDLVEQRRRSAN